MRKEKEKEEEKEKTRYAGVDVVEVLAR